VAFGTSVVRNSAGGVADARDPYNGFIEAAVTESASVQDQMLAIITAGGQPPAFHFLEYMFEVFDDTSADYSLSTAAISVDLKNPFTQHGGFAEGDQLVNVSEVIGSSFDDIIRGSNPSDFPADSISDVKDGTNTQTFLHFTINNPGDNLLFGGNGNDLLEGRGGADILNGGSGVDFASYETSPGGVVVRLPGVGSDTTSGIASGADAKGDTLISIEGLVGSRFDDTLTGNSLNNTLVGGLGNDTLDGKGGTDTVDYSTDHISPLSDAGVADAVVVDLFLGTGAEFKPSHLVLVQFSTDTLINIENVTGTAGSDTIVGNNLSNTLDGRAGNDILDGGVGSDILIGGDGNDTVSFATSHNGSGLDRGTVSLGLNGADGSAIYAAEINGEFFNVETDVLRSIENVTGSNLSEVITGNEQDNILDGGLQNDFLNGGAGVDTASYLSHDSLGGIGTITLGLNGADGGANYGFFVFNRGFVPTETDGLRSVENVTGSNVAETINGNELDNVLNGRGGNDTINGNAGNDTLIGGTGSNTVNGGSGNDTYVFTKGAVDRYFDDRGTDVVQIDSLKDVLQSVRVGNDLVVNLTSGSFTVVNHFAGNPIESLVDLSSGKPVTLATGLIGGNGSGIIAGGNGGETLDGRGGDDLLFGGNGSDRLIGGDGNDRLTGGNGGDTFVFGPGFGQDIVTDFGSADRIEFDGGVFKDFKTVQAAMQQVGNDTVITLDADNSITLQGVAADSLHASHFILA
jgi:Ca2+-binding RTX toxin-like protein